MAKSISSDIGTLTPVSFRFLEKAFNFSIKELGEIDQELFYAHIAVCQDRELAMVQSIHTSHEQSSSSTVQLGVT